MASPAQVTANQANSKKSTGARTPEGRARSSMNSLRHGRRSKKLALLREESYAFQERLRKWMAIGDAQNDVDEYLVYRNVCLSFDLDRAQRARLERCASLVENSDEDELAEIEALGKRLFFDPVAATPLYGNRPGFFEKKTSWNGQPLDENDPAALVKILERTEAGCCWLRQQFQALRAQLASVGFWQSHDRLKIIRLLGCQPVQANEDFRIAQVFLACHALKPAGETAFDDLLSDMGKSQRDQYRKGLRARWPDFFRAREETEWRQMLFDLADRNIEHLDAKLEAHQKNADVVAERTFARLSFDPSPEGEALRNYLLKCTNGLYRGMANYRKCQAKTSDAWRGAGGLGQDRAGLDGSNDRECEAQENHGSEPGADDPFGLKDGQDERLEQAVEVLDRAAQPPSSAGVAGDTDSSTTGLMADTTVSDGLVDSEDSAAPASAGLTDDRNLPEGSELGYGVNAPGGSWHRAGDADDVEHHEDETSGRCEIGEDATSEPNFDETMSITETQGPVQVTANSEALSGLDKGVAQPEECSEQQQGNTDESRSDSANPESPQPQSGDEVCGKRLLAPFSKREQRHMRREENARKAEIILANKLKKGTISLSQILDYAMALRP